MNPTASTSAAVSTELRKTFLQTLELGSLGLAGGLIGYARHLPAGTFAVAFTGGYGLRSNMLEDGHSFARIGGSASFAYAATPWLSLALGVDGRVDKHSGTSFTTDGSDDGYVGEPRLTVRAGKPFGTGAVAAGVQVQVWTPGKDAPSIAASAISVEARGLVDVVAGPARLAFNVGYRLDNSAKSVDDPSAVSLTDQVSYGVSEWNALVAGARIALPSDKWILAADVVAEQYLGSRSLAAAGDPEVDSPGLALITQASFQYRFTDRVTGQLFVGVNPMRKPRDTATNGAVTTGTDEIALAPYRPLFAGGIGLQATFGGPKKAGPDSTPDPVDIVPVDVPKKFATVRGTITDASGAPLAGASVSITTADGRKATAISGADGTFENKDLELIPGGATTGTLTIEMAERKPVTQEITLSEDGGPALTTSLELVTPPGIWIFVVRAFPAGTPLAGATVELQDGTVLTTDATGRVEVSLPPGSYSAKVRAAGYREQAQTASVESESNTFTNVDLRK